MTDKPKESRRLEEAASYASDVGVLGASEKLKAAAGQVLVLVT